MCNGKSPKCSTGGSLKKKSPAYINMWRSDHNQQTDAAEGRAAKDPTHLIGLIGKMVQREQKKLLGSNYRPFPVLWDFR